MPPNSESDLEPVLASLQHLQVKYIVPGAILSANGTKDVRVMASKMMNSCDQWPW